MKLCCLKKFVLPFHTACVSPITLISRANKGLPVVVMTVTIGSKVQRREDVALEDLPLVRRAHVEFILLNKPVIGMRR